MKFHVNDTEKKKGQQEKRALRWSGDFVTLPPRFLLFSTTFYAAFV